jgi:Family of unknown function (DUF5709)
MTDYERSGQRWKDDPATDLIDAYHNHVSEELGTDGPAETFGHPDESLVGHLVEDDEGVRADETPETIAHDSGDLEDLAVEELAMHYVDEDSELPLDDDDLPDYLRASLAE